MSTTTTVPEFRDRTTWLMVFGVLQLLLGLVNAGFALLMTFVILAPPAGAQQPEVSKAAMMFMPLFYSFIAAYLIVAAVGTFRKRRWARIMMLIAGWFWLVMGTMTVLIMAIVIPRMQNLAGRPNVDPAIMKTVMLVMFVFLGLFMVLLPLAIVVFYSRRNVRLTIEAANLAPVGAQKPALVIALALLFGITVPAALWMALWQPYFVFFGSMLSGTVGRVAAILMGALYAYIAVNLWRQERSGWIAAVASTVFFMLSGVVTAVRADLVELYRRMGIPQYQLEAMQQIGMTSGTAMAGTVVVMGIYLLLLWAAKKHYKLQSAAS